MGDIQPLAKVIRIKPIPIEALTASINRGKCAELSSRFYLSHALPDGTKSLLNKLSEANPNAA